MGGGGGGGRGGGVGGGGGGGAAPSNMRTPVFPFPTQVRDIHLTSDLWSVENNFLTPTFKTKRPALVAHFKDVIDAMYKNLE